MKLAMMFASALLLCVTGVYAQSTLVGKYSGSITGEDMQHRTRQFGITIEITSAENGQLKGTILNQGGRACRDAVPAEGAYEGNKVKFAMLEGPRGGEVQGCGKLAFEGVAEGTKLVGKMGFQGTPREVTLSK